MRKENRKPGAFYKGDYVRLKDNPDIYGEIKKNYFWHRDCMVALNQPPRVGMSTRDEYMLFWFQLELDTPSILIEEPSEDIYDDLI